MTARAIVLASHAPSLVDFRGPFLRCLRDRGLDVVAIAPNFAAFPKVGMQLLELGVRLRNIPMARTGLNPLQDAATFAALLSIFRDEKPSLFFGYTAKPVIWGMLAARFAGVPRRYALITGLGFAFGEGRTASKRASQWIAQLLYKAALAGADNVIFQNLDDAVLFQEMGLIAKTNELTVVNGSGVDLDVFSPLPLPLPTQPITFVMIARLLNSKGVNEYVVAAEIVKREHRHVRFILVGGEDPGNPDAVNHETLKRWQNDGAVEWWGHAEDVRDALGAAHVFVLPSYREGTPRSALEAMASGRAIIVADTPGCRETVVEGVNGFKVPKGAVEPLARAMFRFLNSPDLIPAMGAASLKIARSRYDVNKVNLEMLAALGLV